MIFWKDPFHCMWTACFNENSNSFLGTPSLAGASREQRGQVLICMAAPSGGDRSTPASTISPTPCHSYKLAPLHSYRGRRWGCKGKRTSGTILSPWTSTYNFQLSASCFSKLASADRDRGKSAFRWLISLCARFYSKLQEWYLGGKPFFVFSELLIMYWWWPKKSIFRYCPWTSETSSGKAVAVRFQITILGRSLQT